MKKETDTAYFPDITRTIVCTVLARTFSYNRRHVSKCSQLQHLHSVQLCTSEVKTFNSYHILQPHREHVWPFCSETAAMHVFHGLLEGICQCLPTGSAICLQNYLWANDAHVQRVV